MEEKRNDPIPSPPGSPMGSNTDENPHSPVGQDAGGGYALPRLSSIYVRDRRKSALSRFGREAGFGQFLEAAGVEHGSVAEILQRLAAQRRAPARGAVDEHRLVLPAGAVAGGAPRAAPECGHAAR